MTSDRKSDFGITKNDLVKTSLNVGSLGMEFSWTYVNQMGLAFCVMIMNCLKKIWGEGTEGYKQALERNAAFFNITVQLAPFVGGITIAMEEGVAKGKVDPKAINDVKAALMGPLSGVGISMCQAGNLAGPLVFLLIYNIPAFWLRVVGIRYGYEMGTSLLDRAEKSGIMEKVLAAAGIVGIMVIGSMTKDMFGAELAIGFGAGDDATTLQAVLDGIMPGMVGLGFMWLYYWLLGKKISPSVLVLGTMLLGVILVYFGIMA